jgi:hypothetical protein
MMRFMPQRVSRRTVDLEALCPIGTSLQLVEIPLHLLTISRAPIWEHNDSVGLPFALAKT